jgi:phage terminase small subunit
MKNSGERKISLHQSIIDEYFVNGFNGYKAVQSLKGNSIVAAKSMFNTIIKDKNNQEYIQRKRNQLKRKTEVRNENILRELINWSYVDITDFIGLTKEDIKKLPDDVRRCIQSFKVTKRTYKDRGGQERTDEVIEVKLIDKTKAIEMINKHIGFYELDNKQKASKINLTKIDTTTLNVLLRSMDEGN